MKEKKNIKGISLPINMIVILAVAIIVMLVAVSLIFLVFPGTQPMIKDSQAWSRGCMMWQQRGCRGGDMNNIIIEGYDPDGNNQPNSLADACRRYLNYTNEEDCRRACCIIPERGEEQ